MLVALHSRTFEKQGSALCVCVITSRNLKVAETSTVTPQTVAHQAPLSMGFSRQECWSGLSFPSPGDRPDSGVKPRSPALQADSLPFELQGKQKANMYTNNMNTHTHVCACVCVCVCVCVCNHRNSTKGSMNQ